MKIILLIYLTLILLLIIREGVRYEIKAEIKDTKREIEKNNYQGTTKNMYILSRILFGKDEDEDKCKEKEE